MKNTKYKQLPFIFMVILCITILPVNAQEYRESAENVEDSEPENSIENETASTAQNIEESLDVAINSRGDLVSVYYPAYPISMYSNSVETVLSQRARAALDQEILSFDVSDLEIEKTDDNKTLISQVITEVLNSNYRYFYVNGCSYTYYPSTNKIVSIKFVCDSAYINENGEADTKKIHAHLTLLDNAMEEALSCIMPEMSQLEQVLAIHDYLIQICDYDYENYITNTVPSESYTIWGVLINGKAVCQGYAETFCNLMSELGIDCYFVASTPMNHAWNLVSIDGEWYHLDLTWDDPIATGTTHYGRVNNDYADEGHVLHTYFLKSDSEFLSSGHNGWDENIPEASSDGTYQNYCFYNIPVHMNYYDGQWYYLNTSNQNQIYKSQIDGTEKTALTLKNTADYVHSLGDYLYFSNPRGIFSYNLKDGTEELYINIQNQYPRYEVYEFVIQHQQLIGVLYHSGNTSFTREVLVPSEAPSEKILVKLIITSEPQKKDYEAGEALNLSGMEITAVYSDDSQERLGSGYTVTGYNPNTTGKQTIRIAYENIYAEFSITVHRVDPVEAFVKRLYTNILQRNADTDGLNAWSSVLKSGKEEGAKVAQGFIESPEFTSRSLSDDEYIRILYKTFMNREADSSGLSAWKNVLTSGLSRMHVFKGFAESLEFTEICEDYGIIRGNVTLTEPRDVNEKVTLFIIRCYELCLGRKPDMNGLNGWCQQILSGDNTAKQAAYGFVFSNEFTSRDLTDEEYIKILYRVFMDREADTSGLEAWKKVLNSGKDRLHVFNGFSDSPEFRALCESYGIQ